MNTESYPIFSTLIEHKNENEAVGMSAYMRNQFPFLGIKKPVRAQLTNPFLSQKRGEPLVDWNFVFACWRQPWREIHYLALDYLSLVQKKLIPDDLPNLAQLITQNSWWDTVDCLDNFVGVLCLKYPNLKETVYAQFACSDNIWLKRVAIDFQLTYRDKTDTEFLKKVVLSNCATGEFFIDKAIGWSLREYSKTNPQWVKDFIEENRATLSPLSIREGLKKIKKSASS